MLTLNFSKPREQIIKTLSSSEEVFAKVILAFLEEWWNESDFITAETSGSTGIPKEVVLDKSKVLNSALATGDFFKFNSGDNALLCMSPSFIAGKLMIVRADVWKLNLLCIEPTSSPIDYISGDVHIDFVAMVPLQLKNSLKYLNSGMISKLLVGGGAVDVSLQSKLSGFETKVYSSYGMTETITHVAIKKLNGENPSKYFKGLDGVVFCTDDRGCLIINAPKISDSDVVTNDVVELKNDKEFDWLGRYDSVINSGGIKIQPETVERILEKHISLPFFIGGLKDKDLGEKAVLLIEGELSDFNLDSLKPLLPKYQSPKEVFFVNKFVRTDSGKINRIKSMDKLR